MTNGTAFDIELEQLDRAIESADGSASTSEEATRHVTLLYRRATLTGNLDALRTAATEINAALVRVGPWPDLCLLKAQLDFTMHRFQDVQWDLEMAEGLGTTDRARAILADLCLQRGAYDEAGRTYEALARDESWESFARLGHFKGLMGDLDGAEHAYADAEDEITAKEMRSYAWVELQRGSLHLSHGHDGLAWDCYQRADRAYPGYWLVHQHMAEWLAVTGDMEQAAARYSDILSHVSRPEIQQAAGTVCERMGEAPLAASWHEAALTAYLDSAARGEVLYIHHLAELYADIRKDAVEALRWARADLAIRENHLTWAALAWALFLNGDLDDAVAAIERALATGVADGRIYARAAAIYRASGRMDQGDQYLVEASATSSHTHLIHGHD
jgi:tetratricopeptide (TPR) repeat protein